MKNLLLSSFIIVLAFSLSAQNISLGSIEDSTIDLEADKIRSKLAEGGLFLIVDKDDLTKFMFYETGRVQWFLDGEDFFIRDSDFEPYPGQIAPYNFIYVDGEKGRIGFNVLRRHTGYYLWRIAAYKFNSSYGKHCYTRKSA